MRNKYLAVFMAVTMVLSYFTVLPSKSYGAVEGDWLYTLSDGDTTVTITGYTGGLSDLTIPDTLAGKPVTKIGSNAFKDKTGITSVTIPDSVLRIESYAFTNSSLTSVDLGKGVTYIGQYAFNGTGLTSVTIPNSTTWIDMASFALCPSLSQVDIIGNNIKLIGSGAFYGTGITSFRIPTSITVLEDRLFESCTSLTNIIIPANITSIGYYAFGACSSLVSATFEGNAPTTENYIFSNTHSSFKIYYYPSATGFTTPTWTTGLETYNTQIIGSVATYTCSIGGTNYETFADALSAANSGDTITLLSNINLSEKVLVTNKTITLDLNGYTLNINNTSGVGLEVGALGKLSLTGTGELSVTGGGHYGYGAYAHSGGEVEVTNATSTGTSSSGAYAISGGKITVFNDANGLYPTPGTNLYCRGVVAADNASSIIVHGDVGSLNSQAVAITSGNSTIKVKGNVVGYYGGVMAYGGRVDVEGNVTAVDKGSDATDGGKIYIKGDILSTGQNGSGVNVNGNGSYVEVLGDVLCQGLYSIGALSSTDAHVYIKGNLTSDTTGILVANGGLATIDGLISADVGISISHVEYTLDDALTTTTKLGYDTFTDNESTVWVARDIVFFDNFESYADNTYPSSFSLQYNGAGTLSQVVITSNQYNNRPGKVFQLMGQTSWASEQFIPLNGFTSDHIVIDAYIKPVTSTRNAELALRNLSVGTWGTRVASVWFEGDGNILAVRGGNDGDLVDIGNYTVGKWYRVTIDTNTLTKTYDVYVDGVKVAESIATHPSVEATTLSLISHNVAPSTAYFDQVGLYRSLPNLNTVLPSATNVTVSGDTTSGEVLTGEYNFNGTSESGTTFRWLINEGVYREFYSTMNIAGVFNGPTIPTIFALSSPTLISKVQTYHWNNGSGATPGKIYLKDEFDLIYGPWAASGIAGNLYWEVYPNIVLPAGLYTIIDTSNDTWANNSESGYRGMASVYTKDYSSEYLPISGESAITYNLDDSDLGKLIKFEVTVEDAEGLVGIPVVSDAVGPIKAPTVAMPNHGSIQFDSGYYSTYEGYSGNVGVERLEGSEGSVSVSYKTLGDTAIEGVNFISQSGTLSWGDGDTTKKYIPIRVLNDEVYSGNLNLSYVLFDPIGGATFGIQNPLIVQIRDNDNPPTPTNLRGTAGNGEVTIEWDEVNSAYYRLYFSTEAGSFNDKDSVNIYSGTSYLMKGLTNGTTYYFAIKAGHDIYFSDLSEGIDLTPVDPSPAPNPYMPGIIVSTQTDEFSVVNTTKIYGSPFGYSGTVTIFSSIIDTLLTKARITGGITKADSMNVEIEVPSNIEELNVKLSGSNLEKIIDQTDSSFGFTSPLVSIEFNTKAMETIDSIPGDDIIISTKIVGGSEVPSNFEGRPIYEVSILKDNTSIETLDGGRATISLPYTLEPGENPNFLVVYSLTEGGESLLVKGYYDEELKSVVFVTDEISKFVIGYNPMTFDDVNDESIFKDEIEFLAARKVTNGTGEGIFSPDENLSRADFVVLMMRALGLDLGDDVNLTDNFIDAGNTYYTDYLLRAKSLDIIEGMGDNKFYPEKEITRQELYVVLYNFIEALDMDLIEKSSNEISSYLDYSQILPWASNSIQELLKTGLIESEDMTLKPNENIQRDEAVRMIYDLIRMR